MIIEKGSRTQKVHDQILNFERLNPNKPIKKHVNPNDFNDCYDSVEYIIKLFSKDDIIINISSGTKLLSMASILCAFNHGITAYHYEQDRLVKLPVFKDMTIHKRLGVGQIKVLRSISHDMTWDQLKAELEDKDRSPKSSYKDFYSLKKLGLVDVKLLQGETKVVLSPVGKCFKEFFE